MMPNVYIGRSSAAYSASLLSGKSPSDACKSLSRYKFVNFKVLLMLRMAPTYGAGLPWPDFAGSGMVAQVARGWWMGASTTVPGSGRRGWPCGGSIRWP